MGASQFVPLEAELIDEGRFMDNLNTAIRSAQGELRAHARKWGEKAKKAKAKVNIEIMFICLEPDTDSFGVSASIKRTIPAVPPTATVLIGGEDQTGADALFCRKSGSTEDHPAQSKLATKDGRTINIATGEILAAVEEEES